MSMTSFYKEELLQLELLSQLSSPCRQSHPQGRDSRDCRDKGALTLQGLFTELKSDNFGGYYNPFSSNTVLIHDVALKEFTPLQNNASRRSKIN